VSYKVSSLVEENWKSLKVPIKRCEFYRARGNLLALSPDDFEHLVSFVLSSLPEEDRKFIEQNISPKLTEALKGGEEDKSNFLWNLVKLIMYNYKKYKLQFYDAVRSADLKKALLLEKNVFFHYEALRNLKRSLLGGKDLMYIDMPEYIDP
jgi:hypothetical protein